MSEKPQIEVHGNGEDDTKQEEGDGFAIESIRKKIEAIKNDPTLVEPPMPKVPNLNPSIPIKARLRAIQQYINSFEYNYSGRPFVRLRRDRGFRHVVGAAKEVARRALPVQCVEAVFLGALLTAPMRELERFPVSFKSIVEGQIARHIVLAIKYSPGKGEGGGGPSKSGKKEELWGALGISRRSSLMDKPLEYPSLSSLLEEFEHSYEAVHHKLEKLYISFPLPHDLGSNMPIQWRAFKLDVGPRADEPPARRRRRVARAADGFARGARAAREAYLLTGRLAAAAAGAPPPPAAAAAGTDHGTKQKVPVVISTSKSQAAKSKKAELKPEPDLNEAKQKHTGGGVKVINCQTMRKKSSSVDDQETRSAAATAGDALGKVDITQRMVKCIDVDTEKQDIQNQGGEEEQCGTNSSSNASNHGVHSGEADLYVGDIGTNTQPPVSVVQLVNYDSNDEAGGVDILNGDGTDLPLLPEGFSPPTGQGVREERFGSSIVDDGENSNDSEEEVEDQLIPSQQQGSVEPIIQKDKMGGSLIYKGNDEASFVNFLGV